MKANQALAIAIANAKSVAPGAITSAVEDWLDEHVDPDTGYVIDDTLSTTGAAADAKKVGDELADLKSALQDKIDEPASEGTSGQVLTTDGNGGRSWTTVQGGGTDHGVPSGGSSGQVLAKASGTDYDVEWVNQSGGGGDGNVSLQETDAQNVDLDITDSDGYVIMRLANGHVQTKNFDSSNIDPGSSSSSVQIYKTNKQGVELDIADSQGYVVARFADGHIKTANFDSASGYNEIVNPYREVLFAEDEVVTTSTHDHCDSQSTVSVMNNAGVNAFAISNYYPSEPFYPMSEHNVTLPTGCSEMPNAEHIGFTDTSLHMNSIGSTFASGKAYGETPVGINDTWKNGIIKMKRKLLMPDGGGMTINHPTWTGLGLQVMLDILDFDDTVIGIEFYNQDADVNYNKGWAIETWDNILKTGRRCFGFAVPDHYAEGNDSSNWKGTINLFVPENTQAHCLKAIRNGAFYAQINHTSLALTGLYVNGRNVTINVSESASIKTVIDGETADTTTGTTKTVTVPDDAVYVRFEAATSNDTIYTNPFMFKIRK